MNESEVGAKGLENKIEKTEEKKKGNIGPS